MLQTIWVIADKLITFLLVTSLITYFTKNCCFFGKINRESWSILQSSRKLKEMGLHLIKLNSFVLNSPDFPWYSTQTENFLRDAKLEKWKRTKTCLCKIILLLQKIKKFGTYTSLVSVVAANPIEVQIFLLIDLDSVYTIFTNLFIFNLHFSLFIDYLMIS